MSKVVAKLENAGKRYGSREVLKSVSGEIREGEILGIIGPNGGGKSTLLLLLAGLIQPTEGRVDIKGIPAHRVALDSAGLVGLVTARPGLYPLLTGRENLDYFGGLFGLTSTDIANRVEPLVSAFELEGAMDTRLSTWSTGMQQKLSLIRALMLSPALLLFDEPTANLDPYAARTLHAEMRRRADQGPACVLVTHDLVAAESICDQLWFIDGTVRRQIETEGPRVLPESRLLDLWEIEERS